MNLPASTVPYASYKAFEREIRDAAAAWFAARDLPVDPTRPYRLAESVDWRQNLILPEVARSIDDEIAAMREGLRCPFALNANIGHGLSSQAMLFNLVGPLIARKDLAPLYDAVVAAGIPWPGGVARVAFEVEDRQVFDEQHGQPTSVDMVIGGAPGTAPLFVEAKFSEKAFGGCSVVPKQCDGANPAGDHARCYLHRKGMNYWQRMQEHGFIAGDVATAAQCALARHYQFFREVLFALHHGGHFVLLHDARSPLFHNPDAKAGQAGWMQLLAPLVPAAARSRIHQLSVQEILGTVMASGRHDDWAGEFARKYGLSA